MLDGKNALIVNDEQRKLRVRAILLNANGKEIKIDGIKWQLLNNDEKLMSIDDQESSNICNISSNYSGSTVPNNNYVILCAEYKPDSGPVLQAFLPIAMKTKECERIIGADRIIYNHLGTPVYSNASYVAHMNDGIAIKNWELNSPKDEKNKFYISPNYPSLNASTDGGKALAAAPLYSKGNGNGPIYDKVCVYCSDWSQPILIMQSSYDFAMLNEWDGNLTIDEEKGIILSSMIGAGKKNSENKFSGVLIGDLKGGTGLNDTEKMTGVYGFQDGVISYALKEDGSGFFGKNNCGRIEFDGETGIIRSSGWITDNEGNWVLQEKTEEKPWGRSSGTLLDLDDGMLLIYGDTNNYIKFNASGDGRLEMAIPAASINLIDSNGSSKNIAEFTSDSVHLTISKEIALKTRCGTPFSTAIKVIRMSRKDYEQWWSGSQWKFEKGTTISVKFDGEMTQETRPSLEDISFKFAWYPDDNPNTNTPNYPTETTYKVTSVNPDIFNFYKTGDTLIFEYDDDNGNPKFNLTNVGYSNMIQTANSISLTVGQELTDPLDKKITSVESNLSTSIGNVSASVAKKLDKEGSSEAFGWSLTSDGFILYSTINNKQTDVFKCNKDGLIVNGSGNFSGNLTAETTNFTELAVKGFYSDYEGSNQYYQTKINKNQIILAAEWTKSGATRAGQIYIGAPSTSSSFDDISIYAVPLSAHPANHGGYGNLGLSKNPWDMIYVKTNESMRNVKERVEVYNIDQAYEELKNLPIYTYNYQGNTESCRTRFLGTMIDCLPTETIRITPDSDTQYFEPTSLTYWNIAATQAIQQKLENLDNKMNLLEEWMNGINSNNLD